MQRKVIIIGPAFPYRGGIANFNNSLAKEYSNLGYDVKVFSFSMQYPSFLFPGTTQYESGHPPKNIQILSIINSINPFNWIKIAKMIKSEVPDYVVVRYWLPFMAPCLGTIARLIREKTKVIAITDNVIPHEKRLGDNLLTKYFVSMCDGFLTLSSSVLEDLSQFTSNINKKFVPHPIYDSFGELIEKNKARDYLGLDANDKYILFFGFVRHYKGLDLLIEALADQRIKKIGIKLVIAGEFYENKQDYINKISELGVEKNIIIKSDFIEESDVKYYFCAANLVAQTYRTATQSGVTQIAYHFERPMLVTNVGGLSEIIPNNKVGYVCDINVNHITESILDFFQNNREEEFGENVKIEKKRFTWKSVINGIEEIYNGL